MIKILPKELSKTTNNCIHLVNFVEARASNSLIFLLLCKDMGSEHQSLLFHTSVHWLSRSKVLAKFF